MSLRPVPVAEGPDGTWSLRRLGDLVRLTNGYPFDSESFGPDGDLPLVRIRDLFAQDYSTYIAGPVPQSVVLRDGDIVIGMDGDFEAVLWRRGPAALNQRLCLLRPFDGADARFVAYALPAHLKVINDLTYATTVKHLSSFDVLAIRLPIPDRAQQRAIADYLDAETARIDGIVARRRRQVEELDARRSALIVQWVICGQPAGAQAREPAAHLPFPQGWACTRLRFLIGPVQSGDWGDEKTGDGDVFVVRAADFDRRRWRVDPSRLPLRHVDEASVAQRALLAGDLILEKSGGGPGQPVGAVVSYDFDLKAIPSNFAARLRPADGVDARYLCYVFAAAYAVGLTGRSIKQTTGIQNLDVGAFLSEPWRVPWYEEQVRIRTEIDHGLAGIDELWAHLAAQIDLLRERRQALITAAVTGQLEIPGVAA